MSGATVPAIHGWVCPSIDEPTPIQGGGRDEERTWARLVPIVAALALAATGCARAETGGGGSGNRQVTAGDPGRHRAGRRFRPDGTHRRQGHGGRQAGPQRPGPEPARRRQHHRPAAPGQREGQRQGHAADGAGPGRRRLHQQVRRHLDETTPVARLTKAEIVVVAEAPPTSRSTSSSGLEGRPGQALGRRRVRSRRPRPPGPDADRQEAGIDPKQVNFVSYDGGGSCWRPCSAARSTSASPGSARPRTRSRPARSGRWP